MENTLHFPKQGIRAASIASSKPSITIFMFVLCVGLPLFATGADTDSILKIRDFVAENCLDCHQGDEAEGQLDLESLEDFSAPGRPRSSWVRIYDRVNEGEMPPEDYGALDSSAKQAFLASLAKGLKSVELKEREELGRVQGRRLTRKQVERSLHDLLGIDIPLQDLLPEESQQHRYSTVSDGQAMSHFQMQSHLQAVDAALDEAFRRALGPGDEKLRQFNARQIARSNPRRRCREPEMRQGQAVVWNGRTAFYGRLPAAAAREDGWYRFRLTISAIKPPKSGGVWTTVRSGLCVSSAPLLIPLATFEAGLKPKEVEFEAWLPKGHMLEVRPGDATLKTGSFKGGQIGTGEGEPQNIPGIAIDNLTMERIHLGASDADIRRQLFGASTLKQVNTFVRKTDSDEWPTVEKLIRRFAKRAFRVPVKESVLSSYLNAAKVSLENGDGVGSAIRLGYRAILCSPRFLYLVEEGEQLNAHELAVRLSYFLTSGAPDDELMLAANEGRLLTSEGLLAETDRLLGKHGGEQFIRDFAGEWLELDKLGQTLPNRKLYREFDNVVGMTMKKETESFLVDMLQSDANVSGLINAQHTFVNSRLARYYGLSDVPKSEFQKVRLSAKDRSGGLLTHGSILRLTTNGTDTSPVLRGVWISERLLGIHVPPPPDNVPAIEPDIRGATTMREQLLKHRADPACASCHSKVDPAGFALENFDASGQWREYYDNRRKKGPKIDASYKLHDGQEFTDIREFQALIEAKPDDIARCVAENLLVYSTGHEITFSDREFVDAIVEQVADNDYGFRSIVHAVVSSPLFMTK